MSVSRALIRDIVRQRNEPALTTWETWLQEVGMLKLRTKRGRPPTRYAITVRRSDFPESTFDLLIRMARAQFDVTVVQGKLNPDIAKVTLRWG